jgi:cytochrome c oxidase subunit II
MNWLRDFFLPKQASTIAPGYDTLFLAITVISIILFTMVTVMAIYFAKRYRRRRPDEITPHMTHNNALEIVWTVIPLIIVIVLFFWGFHRYMYAIVAPSESMEIVLSAKKWQWEFEYPDGMRSLNELHVPVHRPIRLIMGSQDVLHSFFVADFRVKQDIVPGRFTEVWFEATEPGTYPVQCAEYCGKGHSDMQAKVVVESPSGYERWLKEGDESLKTMPLPEIGKLVYENRGCATCHSLTGERGQGPTWKGIYGRTETMTDGSQQLVNENYIRESILEPQKHIVQGYEGIMPTYKGLLRDREILGVVEYMKTVK